MQSLRKFALAFSEQLLRRVLTSYPDCDLDFGFGNNNIKCNKFSYYALPFCEDWRYSHKRFSSNCRNMFAPVTPYSDIDLGSGNLNSLCNIPTHYASSFCEVSSNLLQ